MLRLRQIAFATTGLPAAERALIDALGVELCFRDPNLITFGLENALFPVGDQFLEIVAPVQDDTTAGRLLERRGGDTGYMVLFQVDDLAPVEDRLGRHDIRVVHEAHEDGIRGLHLHPKDVPGAIVSIDAARQPAEWPWAGGSWRDHVRTDQVTSIVAMEVSTTDPAATRSIWATVLGVDSGPSQRIDLDDAAIDFASAASGEREGITRIDFRAADPERRGATIDLLGVTVRFV